MARSVDDMDLDELSELLKLGTHNLYYAEAAVQLLIRHGYWLKQPEFRRFIEVFDHLTPACAGISWADAAAVLDRGELQAIDQEAANVLRIAASLATFYQLSFRDVMERLSPEAMKHAAEAMMYAAGYTESIAVPKL